MKRMWKRIIVSLTAAVFSVLTAGTALADVVTFGETGRAYWGSNLGEARWEAMESAKLYEVRLYENGSLLYTRSRIEVNGLRTDLSQYMSDNSEYYFEVRAIPTNAQKQKFRAGDWVGSEDTQWATGLGDTDGRFRTYSNGLKYEKYGGQMVVNQWYLIHGNWYYFDADGYMLTGWQQIGEKWYFFDKDGARYSGWKEWAPGKWYYLGPDGKMMVNTVIDGQYVLDASGLWVQ